MIVYVLFLWLVVLYVDHRLTRSNMTSQLNGYGSVSSVLCGKAKAPMQYRVLVPWLFKLVESEKSPVRTYLYVRWVAILVALGTAWYYFALMTTQPMLAITILALFFVWVALYDYTDIYIEIALLSFVLVLMTLQPPLWFIWATIACMIGGLNRETIIIAPIIAVFNGYAIESVSMIFGVCAGLALPRLFYGQKERYCKFNMVMKNLRDLRENDGTPLLLNEYVHFALLSLVVGLLYTLGEPQMTDWAILGVCGMLLVPSKWCELRVFAPISLSAIPLTVRLFA